MIAGECITNGKGTEQWFELWLSCCSIDRGHQDPKQVAPATCRAIRATRKRGLKARYRNHPDGPAVYMVQTARERRTRSVANPSIERAIKGWRPWPPHVNVKHRMREAVIAVSTHSRGWLASSKRHLRHRRCWPYICTAPQWMAA